MALTLGARRVEQVERRAPMTYRFVVEFDEIAGEPLSRPALEWVVAVCADGGLERVVSNAVQDLTTRGLRDLAITVRVCELEPGDDGAPCGCPPAEPKPEADATHGTGETPGANGYPLSPGGYA